MKAKVTMTHEFTAKDIDYLMIAALECGINYWCDKVQIMSQPDNKKIKYASEVIAHGGKLLLSVEGEKYLLTSKDVLEGITKHCEKRNIVPSALIDEHDAEDADCIVQYAIFGELVYG